MANKNVLVNMQLNQNQLLQAAVENIAGDAGGPVAGQVWINTVTHLLKWYNGLAIIDPLARANHSGTQLSSTISDFATAVEAIRLDQMAAPTSDVSLNSHKITSLANGSADSDAVNVSQLNAAIRGYDWKQSVRTADMAGITLATGAVIGSTIGGVVLAANDRFALMGQASGQDNGLYTPNASGPPTRTVDADASVEVTPGLTFFIEEGTFGNQTYQLTTDAPITLGTTPLVFAQVNGGSGFMTAGTGASATGSTINVNAGSTPGSGGPGGGLVADTDDMVIDTNIVVRKFAAAVGDGSSTSIAVTHNLNTRDVVVQVIRATTPWDIVDCYAEATDANNVTVKFNTAPTSNQYRVVVHG